MIKQPFKDVNDGPGLADFLPDVSNGYTAYAGTASERKDGQCSELAVINALQTVKDPEIPVNIYDLGLIYTINIEENNEVLIKMTLTAPGCPVAGEMPVWLEEAVETVAGVKQVLVEMVWDPPWGMDMMSEEAKLELGFL